MNYIFLITGSLILFLYRLNEAWAKDGFTWGYFIKRNIIPSLIAIAFGAVIVASPESAEFYINKVFPALEFKVTGFTSCLMGFAGDVSARYLIGIFDKQKKTIVGLN